MKYIKEFESETGLKMYGTLPQGGSYLKQGMKDKYIDWMEGKDSNSLHSLLKGVWRDCSETLPEPEENVIVFLNLNDETCEYDIKNFSIDIGYQFDGVWHYSSDHSYPAKVTHWMPLPDPPNLL